MINQRSQGTATTAEVAGAAGNIHQPPEATLPRRCGRQTSRRGLLLGFGAFVTAFGSLAAFLAVQ